MYLISPLDYIRELKGYIIMSDWLTSLKTETPQKVQITAILHYEKMKDKALFQY